MPMLLEPAQTTNYMILGLSVIVGSMLLFVGSLALRFRNLRQDLQVLEEVEQNDSQE
jgi:hypothetical protein